MVQSSNVVYARHDVRGAAQDLQATILRAPSAGAEAPVLIWLRGGDFSAGAPEHVEDEQLAQGMAAFGYTTILVDYRRGANESDLRAETRALLPTLQADAARFSGDLPSDMSGAPALAAMEDGAAFLAWLEAHRATEALSEHVLLGGALAGGVTVLNLLHIAPLAGLSLPPIRKAVVTTGAFAYPSFCAPTETQVLAMHGARDARIAPASMRSYAYLAGAGCRYLESAAHQTGTLRLIEGEAERRSLRRMVLFDRGNAVDGGFLDHPDRDVKDRYTVCLFTCVRNEGPFLLEWIAYNRSIGVTHFLIFSNDCDDGTTEILDALQARGIVTHVRNPSTELDSRQHLNISIACARFAKVVRRSDYVILSDVDEFIRIDAADGTLNGLIAAAGHPDVISLTEQLFGFGGVEAFVDHPLLEQFRESEAEPAPGASEKQARRGVKSIMRVKTCIDGLANHRPRIPDEAGLKADWVDGSGAPVPQDFRLQDGGRGLDARGRMGLARVNHYTLRSAESLLVKFERGDAVRGARMNPSYFTKRNGKGALNEGLLPALPALKRSMAELLADAEIRRLHEGSVNRHAAKIARLKQDPDFIEIWAGILDELEPAPEAPPIVGAAEVTPPAEERIVYANAPAGTGSRDLTARVFAAQKADAPLMIWLHSGGFRTGSIDHKNHDMLAAAFAEQGIAMAVPEYRLRCPQTALTEASRKLLPDLLADAEAHDFGLQKHLRGAASIGAMESVFFFLDWLAEHGATQGLTGPLMLGGSSAGAITVLNALSLAKPLGVQLPKFEAAYCFSGAFSFPSYYSPNPTPILALHNPSDPRVPIASIKAYAKQAGAQCNLIVSPKQPHGSPGRFRRETVPHSVERMVAFARENGGRV